MSFAYEGKEEKALNNISFLCACRQNCGFSGAFRFGKSTIANLVTRFYDIDEGEILLDGVRIQDYRLSNLRENCSVVSQQVHLFNDTIANNIAYAAEDKYTREQIIEAAKAAYALEFIENFHKVLIPLLVRMVQLFQVANVSV